MEITTSEAGTLAQHFLERLVPRSRLFRVPEIAMVAYEFPLSLAACLVSSVLASQHSAALVCVSAPTIVRYDGGAGVPYVGVARGLTIAEASTVGLQETVPTADAGLLAQPVT